MKTSFLIRDFLKKFHSLLVSNVLLLGLVSVIEATAILTVVPVVDLLIKPDLQGASFITYKVITAANYLHIPINLLSFICIFLLFNLLASILQIAVKHLILMTKYQVLRDLMVGTFEDFLNARWYFFTNSKQGMLFNTFLNEIRVIGDAYLSMSLFFANLVQLILYLAVPFYISWQVASISIVTALIFAAPFILLGRLNYRLGKLNTSTANQLSSAIQESLASAKVILGFGNRRESVKLLDRVYNIHRQATLKSQTLNIAIPLMYYPLGLLVVVISLFAARRFAVPLSETAALLYSLMRVMPFVGQIPTLKNSVDNFLPSYEQLVNLRKTAKEMEQKTGSRIFDGFTKEIVIENLIFAYPGHKPILTDINIHIPKGKMVAFVGPSGGGKTTLIDMIMGFHEPSSGQITLDGVPVFEFDINSYRHRIGYVPQESILFDMSIRENLRWASESATDVEIKRACQQANAEEFIEGFPKKYDTLVGDRGIRLSGGQIQRIALARAMLRKPDILILDEATSSLDSHSERLIQQAIDAIAKDTTVIIIAHRLSTVANADYIYVLDKGSIVEEGTYVELAQKDGYFSRMIKSQALEAVKGGT
jgi:ATP-binding cassette subfamily B protein